MLTITLATIMALMWYAGYKHGRAAELAARIKSETQLRWELWRKEQSEYAHIIEVSHSPKKGNLPVRVVNGGRST